MSAQFPQSQPRLTPSDTANDSVEQQRPTAASEDSQDSQDSQTVVLNKQQDIYPQAQESASVSQPSNELTSCTNIQEPRHCWICLQDEGEDETERSWKSPCPCNLRAHEDCLLEWITDLEAPTRKGVPPSQILCPQCKAEIYVARPRDLLVSFIDIVGRSLRTLVLPFGLSTTFAILYTASTVHGYNSLALVFGRDYTYRMVNQILESGRITNYATKVVRFTDPFLFIIPNWKLFLGLPSIAPALILSRTSVADHMFSALPILYFAMHRDGRFLKQWPPSPGLSFAVLPYFRAAYKEIYNQTFSKLEKEWDQAVQRKPREGETAEQVAAAAAQDEGDDNIINIEIDLEVDGGMDGDMDVRFGDQDLPPQVQEELREEIVNQLQGEQAGEVQVVEIPPGGDAAVEEPNARPDPAGEAPLNPDAQNQQIPPRQPGNPGQLALMDDALGREGISINRVAQSVLGAIFLPAISGVMGEILRKVLPKALVQIPRSSRYGMTTYGPPTGLLQEKWGRSLVGGCFFIVIKDALLLYSKWRKAKNHGKRRVVDYVNKVGKAGK